MLPMLLLPSVLCPQRAVEVVEVVLSMLYFVDASFVPGMYERTPVVSRSVVEWCCGALGETSESETLGGYDVKRSVLWELKLIFYPSAGGFKKNKKTKKTLCCVRGVLTWASVHHASPVWPDSGEHL